MFEQEVKNLYNNILSDKNSSVNLKIQVLKNLQTYLQEEDTRMQQADRDCKWKYIFKFHSGAAVSILCDSFLIQIPTYPILDKGVELKKILHKLPKVVYKLNVHADFNILTEGKGLYFLIMFSKGSLTDLKKFKN